MNLSAFIGGALSAAFYIIYTGLQSPVGLLFDRQKPRMLLTASSFVCALGCFLFAASHTLIGLFLGRILIGAGSAFAFVGLSHLLREYFPKKQFAFMIGLSETIGFIAAVFSIIGMGTVINFYGWHGFINGAGFIGLLIAGAAWKYIPAELPKNISNESFKRQVSILLVNKYLWINGLFIGLSFTIVTVFGALWSIPFLQEKLACDSRQASFVSAFFFLGASVSCPLFGWFSTQFSCRKLIILSSLFSTIFLFLTILYLPTQNSVFISFLMFTIGLCCGAYILAYPIANELAPPKSLSACTGFINTLALVTTPLLQPFIGYLLDILSGNKVYTLSDYQSALLVIPISLLIASVLVYCLPAQVQNHLSD